MLRRFMLKKPPAPSGVRALTGVLIFTALLSAAGCAAPASDASPGQAKLPAASAAAGTISSIRPENSALDPTGSLRRIMSILGQPAPPAVDASEVVIRMPGDVIKADVQPPDPALAVGAKAQLAQDSVNIVQPVGR